MESRRAALAALTAAIRPGAQGISHARQRAALIGATLALTLMVDVSVSLQLNLSKYAANGGGSHGTVAPPWTVFLSLAVPLVAALALVWGPGFISRRPLSTATDPLCWPRARGSEATAVTASPPVSRWLWHRQWWPGTWRAQVHAVSLTAAILASVVADLLAAMPAARPVAQWWWVASVALVVIASATTGTAMRLSGKAQLQVWMAPAQLRAASGDAALLLVLVIGSLALRLPDLTTLPYVVHGDEAACALEAVRWLHGDVHSLIETGWYGLPVLGYAPPALVLLVAGVNLWALRLSTVLIGTATVALLYALAREVAGRRLAFMAAALLAVAHIDIEFSRTGFHYIHAPFVVVLTLWLLVRALRRESAVAAALAGVGLSLALQVYFSARVLYIIVPLFLLGYWLADRQRVARRVRIIGWLALSFVAAVGPLGVYFLQNAAPLVGRPSDVLILNLTPLMRDHLISLFGTADLAVVISRQVAAAPLLLGTLTDQSLQYGAHYPLFDPLVAALIVIGFGYALLRLKEPICMLLVSWVLLTVVLGVVLVVDMPSWPKVLVMVPALCLLAALAAEAILRWLESVTLAVAQSLNSEDEVRGWRLAVPITLLVAGFILYSGAVSAHHYFVDYPSTVNIDPNRTTPTDVGWYLTTVPTDTQVVFFSSGDISWGYSTLQFFAPQLSGQQVSDPQQLMAALSHRGNKPTLLIVTQSAMQTFDTLRTTSGELPPGRYTARPNMWGRVSFVTYAIAAPAAPGS
jgi:4-amino-4-deoxy-L-arabinose transferase-like glycosyltransferase